MEFKKLVSSDMEGKYKDMVNRVTADPFQEKMGLAEPITYAQKRTQYYNRLELERKEFNRTIDKIKATRRARLQKEEDLRRAIQWDKQRFIPICFIIIVGFLLAGVLSFVAMKKGATVWVKEVLLYEAGFKTFIGLFDGFDEGIKPAGFEIGVLCAVLVVVGWIVAFSIFIKKGEGGVCSSIFFGGLFFGGLSLAVPFFAFRLLMVGLSYIVYFLLTPLGIVALGIAVVIAVLIVGTGLSLARFKVTMYVLLLVLVGGCIGSAYMGKGYVQEARNYHLFHDGKSMLTAVDIEFGETRTIHIRKGEEIHYFVIQPKETNIYTIYSSKAEHLMGSLYSEDRQAIRTEQSEYDDLYFYCTLEVGETYYFKIMYDGYSTNCHFQLHFEEGKVVEDKGK